MQVKKGNPNLLVNKGKLLKFLFLLFLLFILFTLVKKVIREILQAKPIKNFNLKQKRGCKSKFKLKRNLKFKVRLDYLNYFFAITGILLLQKSFLTEQFIYLDKLVDNKKNTVFFSCRHPFF